MVGQLLNVGLMMVKISRLMVDEIIGWLLGYALGSMFPGEDMVYQHYEVGELPL